MCSSTRYCRSLDEIDDSAKMAPEKLRKFLDFFCERISNLHGSQFLNRRSPTAELETREKQKLSYLFSRYVDVIDCSKITRNSCPYMLNRCYQKPNYGELARIQVEPRGDRSLFIWRCFQGRCGTKSHKPCRLFLLFV